MSKFLLCILFITNLFTVNGWGYKKNETHTTPDIGKYYEIIKDTKSYYVGNTNEKIIYLTFDVGYDNGNLEPILETLANYNVKATFFITGDFVKRFPLLVTKLSLSDHLVASHSYDHLNITKVSKERLKEDLDKLKSTYSSLTNKELSNYFRPPEGCFTKDSLLYVNSLGYKNIFWSVAWVDWNPNKQLGKEYSYNSYVNNLHNGAIVLMHTVSSSNKEALPSIIEYSLNNGYHFETVDKIKELY